jgi:hypothetical protein
MSTLGLMSPTTATQPVATTAVATSVVVNELVDVLTRHYGDTAIPADRTAELFAATQAVLDARTRDSQVTGATLTETEVRALLDISRAELRRRRHAYEIMAVPQLDGDEARYQIYLAEPNSDQLTYTYPAWQFADGEIRDAVKQVGSAWYATYPNCDHGAIRRWAQHSYEELDGLTPIEWITTGRPTEHVVWFARVAADKLAH